ncbi:nuclear pore complex protein DDB_G0274915-like, partial [Saccostrea cucullata]|uniref:nuclear pore complex protein DDB_G0274915-like n=1 Tax=Saccostrea cuccullata TaxID=36930 RepID=UPI002ED20222
ISILCASVLFERWSSSGWIRADKRKQKKQKGPGGEKEKLSVTNGGFLNMFLNRSFQDKSKVSKSTVRSPWKFGSNSPPLENRIRSRNAVSRNHSFAGRRSDFNNSRITDSRLTSIPFLPTVRKALGLDNVSRSPLTKTPEVAAAYPERPMAGFLPAVRLGRRERPLFSPSSRTIGKSPNTVKIAPPDSRRINNTRLFQVKNENVKATPNTQAVLSALKEKSRKRTMEGMDVTISDVQGQMAKRRRQESQQSNASTSSLPSLPDNLPDLSTQGYTIPRLKTPTLKRTLNMTNLSETDWEDSERENSQKRPRREAQYNSIASSLSSMRRIKERQAAMKRKNDSKENSGLLEDRSGQNSPVTKKPSLQSMETVLLPENKDIPVTKSQKTEDASKSQLSDLETSVAEFLGQSGTNKSVRTPKRVALSDKVSARKRDMSLYAGLNKTYENVPQANVIAKIEDYDKDREEEEKRVQEMMAEIGEPEKEVTTAESTSSTTVSTAAPALTSAVSPLVNISTPVTLGSTTPISVTSSLPVSSTTASSKASPTLFSVNTTTSSSSVSPASKPLATAGFSFGGSPSGVGGVDKSSAMASLSSSTTTVTSASGAIASAAPFSLPTAASSATKTSSVTGFQFGQSLATAAVSPTSTPASTTITGILSSGPSSTTTALPPVFGGQTNALVTSSSGPGAFKTGEKVLVTTSAVSALPTIGAPSGFSFGTQSTGASATVTPTTTSSVGGFSFGGQNSSEVSSVSSVTKPPSTAGGFTFGGTTTTASSLSNGFSFGSQTTALSTATTAGGVSFSSPAATNAMTASAPGGFNFKATPATQANPLGAFNFEAGKGTVAASTTSGTFVFGGNSTPSVGVNAGASTTSAAESFNFGTITANPISAPTATGGFNFGTQNQAPTPSTSTTAGMFSFGGQNVSSTTSSASGGFNFGGGSNSTAGGFNFGKSNTSTTAAGLFGATNTSKSDLPKPTFAFGAVTQNSTTSSSSFGQQPAGSQSSSTFTFGQTTTAASSVFGQPSAPQSSSVFGQFQPPGQISQSQPPAFGSNTSNSTFGQSSNTQAVFGQPAGSQTTSGFGQAAQGTSGFGQSASIPGFGQSSTQPSFNFGQQNPNTQSGSGFGQQTAPQSSFAFGQTPSTQQTTFGQQQPSFGRQPGPAFGQHQNPPAFGQSTGASGFTKSASSPNFGASNMNGSGTGFNFGMATPLKNSQSSAGSSTFNFGTPQNNSATPNQSTPANPSKGFDFSQSLAPGAFNFGAGGGNSSFGTPSGGAIPQPNFGTPSFSVGSGNQAKPRPIRKPIRRTRR